MISSSQFLPGGSDDNHIQINPTPKKIRKYTMQRGIPDTNPRIYAKFHLNGRVDTGHSRSHPFVNSKVEKSLVHLSLRDFDFKTFQYTRESPQTRAFFPGLYIAASMMRIGEKAKFIVPPHLGYGEEGKREYNVPPGSWLILEMHMIEGDGKRQQGKKIE